MPPNTNWQGAIARDRLGCHILLRTSYRCLAGCNRTNGTLLCSTLLSLLMDCTYWRHKLPSVCTEYKTFVDATLNNIFLNHDPYLLKYCILPAFFRCTLHLELWFFFFSLQIQNPTGHIFCDGGGRQIPWTVVHKRKVYNLRTRQMFKLSQKSSKRTCCIKPQTSHLHWTFGCQLCWSR